MSEKEKPKALQIIIGLIFMVAMVFFGPKLFNYSNNSSKSSSGGGYNNVDKQLLKASSEFNTQTPFMLDEDTSFDNMIAFPDKILQCNLTIVDMTKEEIDPDYFENVKSLVIDLMRNDTDMEFFRQHNVTIKLAYKDMENVFIKYENITPDMYK